MLLGSEKVGFQRHGAILKAWRLAAISEHFGKAWREDRQNRAIRAYKGIESYNFMGVPKTDIAGFYSLREFGIVSALYLTI